PGSVDQRAVGQVGGNPGPGPVSLAVALEGASPGDPDGVLPAAELVGAGLGGLGLLLLGAGTASLGLPSGLGDRQVHSALDLRGQERATHLAPDQVYGQLAPVHDLSGREELLD